jgi:hypothetical protein
LLNNFAFRNKQNKLDTSEKSISATYSSEKDGSSRRECTINERAKDHDGEKFEGNSLRFSFEFSDKFKFHTSSHDKLIL